MDDHTPVIYETATFTNDRQKLSLSVEKKDSETDEPIGGAVFGLYADEDIRNVDEKSYHRNRYFALRQQFQMRMVS